MKHLLLLIVLLIVLSCLIHERNQPFKATYYYQERLEDQNKPIPINIPPQEVDYLDEVSNILFRGEAQETHQAYVQKRERHGDNTRRIPATLTPTSTSFIGRRPRSVPVDPYSPFSMGIEYNNSRQVQTYF